MSQDKAASLTNALFARKGRATPAGLLISDLAEGEAPAAGGEPPLDLREAHDGAPLKRSALELKGQPGRKAAKQAAGDLPLLAFAEAQVAADKRQGGAADDAAAGEPSPAASLLERGGGGLRRANGLALDDPAAEGARVVDDAVSAELAEELADNSSDEAAVEAVETVSGDANVTAIEDAPSEESGAVTVATAASEADVAEDIEAQNADASSSSAQSEIKSKAEITEIVEDVSAAVADEQDKTPEEIRESPAPSPELKAAGDAAISATLALRQATAQRAAKSQGSYRPSAQQATPKAGGANALWRSAAVVTLGLCLGLGTYVYVSSSRDADGSQQVAAPVVESLTEAPQAATPPASVEAALEPPASEAATEPPTPEPQQAVAVLPEPSFDIIRIEPDGQSVIAGRAQPFSEWILLNNGRPIASVKADVNGEWVVLPDASLVPGANAFSLVAKTERGKVAIPAPAAAAPEAAPAVPSQSTAPRVEAAPAAPVDLPQAKPQPPVASAPVFRARPEGSYEVQLASVRQSADAERERQRLTTAFPGLLGELELHVQEASVEGAGIFYRVRSGALAHLGQAREVCRLLEGEGQGCLVVKRVAAAAPPSAPPEGAQEIEEGAEPLSPPPQQAERPQ